MNDLSKIVYLSAAQYETLKTNGSITVGGTTINYSNDDLYLTPDTTVPTGGTTGQVLTKASNSDYDTVWGTPFERVETVYESDNTSAKPRLNSGYNFSNFYTFDLSKYKRVRIYYAVYSHLVVSDSIGTNSGVLELDLSNHENSTYAFSGCVVPYCHALQTTPQIEYNMSIQAIYEFSNNHMWFNFSYSGSTATSTANGSGYYVYKIEGVY